jgi:iron complex transport system ATP-binding protein
MIKIDNLTVARADAVILDGYSLSVARGSVLAVLGSNGVGKTTLLNCIVGLLRPSTGSITVDGRIGYVPQLFHAAFAYSVLDIVLMGRARHIGLFGSPSAADYAVARRYLDLMEVRHLEERAFNTLSGGQKQLVMIAQALASECTILILDEPCSALDYKNQSIVISMLRSLNTQLGQTIIFSTHLPQHGLELASDVLLMQDSRSYRYGRTEDILTADNLSGLYNVPIDKVQFIGTDKFTFVPRFAG